MNQNAEATSHEKKGQDVSVVLLLMTDGRRDCLQRTVTRLDKMVTGPFTRRIIHDDSGDPGYRAWLADTFPEFELVATDRRAGFGGAIRNAWQYLATHTDEPWVFHVEDDFLFVRPVHLGNIVQVMQQPHLAQMAFRRQAWNAAEHAAGGVVEQHPDDYTQVTAGRWTWLEHRRFFTTNPCLYRRSLLTGNWPDGNQSEGRFGLGLLKNGTPEVPGPLVRFGFWGARHDQPWVEHIGVQRVGVGY